LGKKIKETPEPDTNDSTAENVDSDGDEVIALEIHANGSTETEALSADGVPAVLFENQADLNSALAQLMEEAERAVSKKDRKDPKMPTGRIPTQPLPIIHDHASDEELSFLRGQVDVLNERLRIFQVDIERSKRRADEQRQHLRAELTATLLKNILPALDTLFLAIRNGQMMVETHPDLKDLHIGLTMTAEQLKQAFQLVGVETLNPVGLPFDPQVHEASESVPSDEHPSGTVLDVVQIGYRIGTRLVRPARVRVTIGAKEKASSLRDLEALANGTINDD